MQFYMCQTPEGEQLAPTQADAKALDKKFVPHDVPTDKPSLMGYINGLLRRIAVATAVAETDFPTPVVIRDPNPQRESKVPGGCRNCDRTPRAAAMIDQSKTLMEIEDLIWDFFEDRVYIENILSAAQERLKDFGGQENAQG